MGVSISLSRSKPGTRSSLRLKVSVCNAAFFLYPGLSVNTSLWDNKNKKIRTNSIEASMVNTRLATIVADIEYLLNQFKYKNEGRTYLELKHQILERYKPNYTNYNDLTKSPLVSQFFSGMLSDMTDGKKLHNRRKMAASTISSYIQSYKYYCEFEGLKDTKYHLYDFKKRELNTYRVFLGNKGLSESTIDKVITHLRTVFNYAVSLGKIEKIQVLLMEFKNLNSNKTNKQIYLHEEEVKAFAMLECRTKKMELARDLFILGCRTGMRASDLVRLNSFEVVQNRIHVLQQKTGCQALVPMKQDVLFIYEKYNYNFPSISYSTFYRYVKELGKMLPTLNEMMVIHDRKNKSTKSISRLDLFATHTARRTMVTLELLNNASAYDIMRIAGFNTTKCFLVYVRASSEELAQKAAKFWGLK